MTIKATQKIYSRIRDILVNDTTSFALITTKLIDNANTYPMIYLGMTDSAKINLSTGVQADESHFEIYIMANNPPENYEKGGIETLLDLASEVEYALAKPMNWSTNHLGFEGTVKDSYIEDITLYDDEASANGNIACVISFTVIHVGSAILKPMQPTILKFS